MRFTGRVGIVLLAAVAIGMWSLAAQPAPPAGSSPQLTTQRLRQPGWWPTKSDASRKDYIGSEACAGCHQPEVLSQQKTSMARAATRGSDTAVLRSQAKISLDSPPFHTEILRDRKGSTYAVGRGSDVMSGPILWTMGDGAMGQTFILQSGASLFESELSYFPSIAALDLTPGHLRAAPRDLEGAFGQRQSEAAAQHCFACHTTESSTHGQFDPTHATAGLTCEACHGPGAKHVEAMSLNRIDEGKSAILDPGSFDPVKLSDYCGACHRAPMDIAADKDNSAINVRFQPYRLAKSRCFSRPDRRIGCTACHNPHEQVVRDAGFYDAKCLACHASKAIPPAAGAESGVHDIASARMAPACPVSDDRCASCHMPKYNVPQMHGKFTDHDIRIVHAGEPYPL